MILAFGGEMGFFTPADSETIEASTANTYNTTFARGNTKVIEGPTYAETPDIGSSLVNAWMHFELAALGGSNGVVKDIFEWFDNAGTGRIKIRHEAQTGDTTFWYNIGAGYVQLGSTINVQFVTSSGVTTVLQTCDINVFCNSAGGYIRFYVAGTERFNESFNSTAIAQLNKARFYPHQDVSAGRPTEYVSQVVIADESTIGMAVMTLYASGDGPDTAWTNTWAEIDELVYSDADGINTVNNNDVENFAGTLVSRIDIYSIRAVCVTARARRSATGPQNIQLNLNVGGTNYFSATKALDVAFKAFVNVWETNPATGVAWQPSDIATGSSTSANIKFGVKSIA